MNKPAHRPSEFSDTRHVWDGVKETGLPELGMFGWGDHMRDAGPPLPPHQHGAYEVCLILRGEVEWWAGLEVHRVARGEVYVTRPGELHGGVDSILHRCELYWVHLATPGPGRDYGLKRGESRCLQAALDGLSRRTFPGSAGVLWQMKRLHELLCEPGPLAVAARRNAALGLALEVIAAHGRAEPRRGGGGVVSPPIRRAMDFIAGHLSEDFRIDDAAAAAGMGLSRFHECFAHEVGLSPGDYRTRLRIRRAKELLVETDWSMTRVGHHLGFASSQYFATAFRRAAGVSPRRYRESRQKP